MIPPHFTKFLLAAVLLPAAYEALAMSTATLPRIRTADELVEVRLRELARAAEDGKRGAELEVAAARYRAAREEQVADRRERNPWAPTARRPDAVAESVHAIRTSDATWLVTLSRTKKARTVFSTDPRDVAAAVIAVCRPDARMPVPRELAERFLVEHRDQIEKTPDGWHFDVEHVRTWSAQ